MEKIPTNSTEKRITATFEDVEDFESKFIEFVSGGQSKIYDRYSYPELIDRENQIAESIHVEKGNVLLYSSGMAAINDALLFSLKKGDVLFYDPNAYYLTPNLIKDYEKMGINCISVDLANVDDFTVKAKKYKPTVIIGETVTNSGMTAISLDKIVEVIGQQNAINETEKSFKDIIRKKIIKSKLFSNQTSDETKLESVVDILHNVASEIYNSRSYMPLRRIYNELLKNTEVPTRSILLELKMMIDSAWANKREEKIKLILDNTLPGPKGNDDLVEKIKTVSSPIVVVESGTKFYADDQANLGLIYGNDQDMLTNLRIQRMRTGNILPPSAESKLPDISEEKLEKQKINLKNTKSLANTLSRLIGVSGIKSVKYPTEFESGKSLLSPILYVECEDPKKLAVRIKEILDSEKITCKYSVSFGFDDLRLFYVPGEKLLRIAGGREDEDTNVKMCDLLLNNLSK